MRNRYDAIIIGAGPAGLACATKLAQHGVSSLVVERKTKIGPKVCAGGITWSGLLQSVPQSLIEQSFPCQHVHSRLQKIRVHADTPIIATVNRAKMGGHMAEQAIQAGVAIRTSTSMRQMTDSSVELYDHLSHRSSTVGYDYLIGADGSSSLVRRLLGIPSEKIGIGINYQIDGICSRMEWHLNNRYFANGYGWIFPHSDTLSIGAYAPAHSLSPVRLKKGLQRWALKRGFNLSRLPCQAGYINYDFRGYRFGNRYLIGDAGGFASALTGEGIYPAIVTGESVAEQIVDPQSDMTRMERIIEQQRRFSRMVSYTARSPLFSSVLAEVGVFALRVRLIDFTMLEMSR